MILSFNLSETQRWIVSLCDFFYVLFRLRSAISHLSTVVLIIAKSLSHITSFQYVVCFIICDNKKIIVLNVRWIKLNDINFMTFWFLYFHQKFHLYHHDEFRIDFISMKLKKIRHVVNCHEQIFKRQAIYIETKYVKAHDWAVSMWKYLQLFN